MRKERTVAAVHMVARRNGRPYSGFSFDSRGHHGDIRGISPDAHGASSSCVVPMGWRCDCNCWCSHRTFCSHYCGCSNRYQESPGVFHRLSTWFHVPRYRFRRVRCSNLPHGDSRILQSTSVPWFRLCHSRYAPRTRHAQDGSSS